MRDDGRARLGRGSWLCGIAAIVAIGLLACERPPEGLWVRFPGPVDLEVGAAVRYQGVPVGEVTSVTLQQETPASPAVVEVGIHVESPGITLRAADVFEIESDGLLGENYVAITAATQASEPLPPGARIDGTPPLSVRVREGAHDAIESLSDFAREQTDALIEALAEAEEALKEAPEGGEARPGGADPPGDATDDR